MEAYMKNSSHSNTCPLLKSKLLKNYLATRYKLVGRRQVAKFASTSYIVT